MTFSPFLQFLAIALAAVSAFGADLQPPKGYVVQELGGLGIEVLKPKDWFYDTNNLPGTVAYRIAKEDLSTGQGFITGLTINIIPKASKIGGKKPSTHATEYLDGSKRKAAVVQEEKPHKQDGWERKGLLLDERLHLMGRDVDCRVAVTTYADDESDLLVVMIFGCPKDEWAANEKIHRTVCPSSLALKKKSAGK